MAMSETSHTIVSLLSTNNVEVDRTHLAQLKEETMDEIQANAADVEIELSAIECPKLLKREMKYLFPQMETQKMANVTIFNLTQKSEFDMKAWSEAMEEEREKLTASFIMSANAICSTLHRFGYWADFIDPSSGRPYMGDYTNHTLFETNDAYKQMGFRIEDLGCCKVLQHACWGSNAFVGTIFTDAPLDGGVVSDILRKVTQEVGIHTFINRAHFLSDRRIRFHCQTPYESICRRFPVFSIFFCKMISLKNLNKLECIVHRPLYFILFLRFLAK